MKFKKQLKTIRKIAENITSKEFKKDCEEYNIIIKNKKIKERYNMETEIKDYNLMYADNNEDIIGYVADMIKYFKAYSKELIEKMEDKTELDMCYEFIEELEELECKDTTLIKAYYNPMGKYEYTIILDY